MTMTESRSSARLQAQAKSHLRATGWSYRTAARRLGVCYQHLCYVLNGHRESRSLLQRVLELPKAA